MLSKSFIPFKRVANFLGCNAKDSQENIADGEWDSQSHDIMSDPLGGLAMRPGYVALTSATVGASTSWIGFTHFHKSSGTDHYIGGDSAGKLWSFETNQYVNLLTGLTTGANKRLSFHVLNDICVILNGSENAKSYTGSGSAGTLGGTLVTGDWGLEWQRYSWIHSTADPRLLYYCTTAGNPESGYTSFLNFDEDGFGLTGAIKQGDDMVVGKEVGLHRVQYTGSSPFVRKYKIPSTVGPINHWVLKSTYDGKVMFLAPDYQVYMLVGDKVTEIGDNVKAILKAGQASRFQHAVAGLSEARKWYFLSFTYSGSATANDKTLVCDYSRPYLDKFQKLQYPWFVFNFGANCFAEIISNKRKLLYFGGAVGKMYQYDSGTNDDGTAIQNVYYSKHDSQGDPSIEKKYSKFIIAYRNKGNYNLDIGFMVDRNANSRKEITQAMLGGQGVNTLWDAFNWDQSNWADADDTDVGRDIDRVGKLLQVDFGTDGVDQDWSIDYYIIMAKALTKGASRVKE